MHGMGHDREKGMTYGMGCSTKRLQGDLAKGRRAGAKALGLDPH